MGIRLQDAAHLIKLMSPADQTYYGQYPYWQLSQQNVAAAQQAIDIQPDSHPPPKTSALERDEQRSFANWILLQISGGRKIPFVWHSTAHRSKATRGTPDFLVGINGKWLSLEFKRDYSSELSVEQQQFREACIAQRLDYWIVYSAAEAINLVEQADSLW